MGNQITLALGTTTEQMKALYFNATQLREPSYRLWQLNTNGNRYYYSVDETTGEPTFYPSVTTILHNVMPENKFLTEWKLSLGKDEALAYTMERANYGTFVHGQLAQLMISRRYDLDGVRDEMTKFVEREKLPLGFVDAHEDEAKADIKAFAKWMKDYDVRPYAVEVSLFSPAYGYAGMIDCVCNMREFSKEDELKAVEKANGDEKKLAKVAEKFSSRIDAIVDFKSGKKCFYDEYKLQLELYRMMWNENFPDKSIERIFNIAPKDWTKTAKKAPSYTFEEQTGDEELAKIPALLELYRLSDKDERKVCVVSGMIDLDSDKDDNVAVYTLAELVKNANKEKAQDEATDEEEDPFKALLGGE